ncbi:MAG: two-component sensor histidine kinase, partial [Thermobispora bispora]|nr:two-component sensor histidine kinase [Thermobispora bispora]
MRTSWPLRHRLLAALLGLCAAGLAGFALVGVLLLDRSLMSRVDHQLTELAGGFTRRPPAPPTAAPAAPPGPELPT